MPEGWRLARLRDVAQVNPPEPALAEDAPFVPMDAVEPGGRWPRYWEERRDRAGARARARDTIFARITPCLENGKVAQVPSDIPRCGGSTEFLVIRAQAGVDPDYLYLWATSQTVRLTASGLMTGTTGRQRLAASDLASLTLPVPTLAEQRRIVDLIGAVDEFKALAEATLAASEKVLMSQLDQWFSNPPGDGVRTVGSLAALGSGPSWKAEDVSPTVGDGFLPVVGIPSTPSGTRTLDATRRVFVRGLPATVRTLSKDSLLLIRTNGNRSRIGNAYRVPEDAVGHAFSAFQIGASVFDPRDTAYLFWYLTHPTAQKRMSDAASGSTGLGNVSVRWLSRLQVPWPDEPDRRRLVSMADAIDDETAAVRALIDRLASARLALLDDLLSGNHPMPASYDRFLNDAA
jgi:type I restriction enzyme S subunit